MSERFLKQVATAAWLGVALGLLIGVLLLGLSIAFGRAVSGGSIVADLPPRAVLAAIVCGGPAIGLWAGRRRMELMGLLGLIAGPAAFGVAHLLHGAMARSLQGATAGPESPTPGQFAILRAIEFGLLGAVIGIISRRPWGTLRTHAAAGLAFGLVYCGVVLLIAVQGSRTLPSAYSLTATGLNEVLLPLGCSLVLFAAGAIGRRDRAGDAEAQAPS